MKEIIEKIKDILSLELNNKKVFDKDVAGALGLSKESLSQMKKRDAIPYEQISKFCAKRKISINWVLFDQLPRSLEEETEKYTRIKYFKTINASAGGGGINYEEEFEEILIDSVILNSLYKSNQINPKHIIAINVLGDSMEPTIKDNEIILINQHDTDIQNGGIFVITSKAGLFVKRVAKKLDATLELISDNINYSNEIIEESEIINISIVGRVVGQVSSFG